VGPAGEGVLQWGDYISGEQVPRLGMRLDHLVHPFNCRVSPRGGGDSSSTPGYSMIPRMTRQVV